MSEDWPKSKSQIRRLAVQSPESLERWALELLEDNRRMREALTLTEYAIRAGYLRVSQLGTQGGEAVTIIRAALEGK